MSLLTSSQKFRQDILNKNLKELPDQLQRKNVAQNNPILTTYGNDLGKEANASSTTKVKNPGDIFTYASKQRQENLKNNANFDKPEDIIAGDANFTETTKFSENHNNSLGKEARVNSANKISNKEDVTTQADVTRELNLQKNKDVAASYLQQSNNNRLTKNALSEYGQLYANRGSEYTVSDHNVVNQPSLNSFDHVTNYGNINLNYLVPKSFSVYTVTVNTLRDFLGSTKYIDANSANLNYGFEPNEYIPSDFLNLRTTTSPLGVLGKEPPLENETRMMNIAAKSLQFNFRARIYQELEEETYGRLGIFDAATNPAKAIDLIKDPSNELIQKNYNITVPSNPLAKFGTFLASLTGFEIPTNIIPVSNKILVPTCFRELNNGEVPSVVGQPLRGEQRSKLLLKYTSAGQKASLFTNMKLNIYAPDYDVQRTSNIGQALDRLKDKINNVVGFLGGNPPQPRKYIGHVSSDYNSIMQNEEGDAIVRSNNYLTEAFTGPSEIEPETSQYGKLNTSLTWSSDKFDDVNEYRANTNTRFSSDIKNRFVDCSIMDRTQKLMNEGGTAKFISQLNHTFDDGFERTSKGSGVKKTKQVTTSDGRRIYAVASPEEVENEFCRTWTKAEPYHKIKHAIRYKELIRKERSSIISRNANYNIYPSQINVNTNYITDNADQGELGGKRATKYMLSIENLAWKDYEEFDELPECEKGVNGGRVMWFPPYNLDFTDRSTATWNEHNFVGRPEPMFSYNYTKRTGTLQFDIVVDHPSIMNMLVQSELQNLNDEQVDDILNSFWSGCIEFDIFELARVWGVFTTSEIEYFKQLLDNIDKKQSNQEAQKTYGIPRDEPVKDERSINNVNPSSIKSQLQDKFIVFENDIPQTENDRDGKILPIDDYVVSFYSNLNGVNNSVNGFKAKNWKQQQFNVIKQNLQKLPDLTSGKHVTLKVNSYASPLYNGSDDQQELYNQKLARRRLVSFAKFIANIINVKNDEQGLTISPDDININFINDRDEIELYKQNKTSTKLDRLTLKINNVRQVTKEEIEGQFGEEYTTRFEDNSGNSIVCTLEDYNDPSKPECSINSIPAIFSRRVEISEVEFEDNKSEDEEDGDGSNRQPKQGVIEDSNLTLTKRDIAQRILNKFVTECDYFEYLRANSPTVFQSLKQKLKYFMPSFHSMTPEGLNARQTFLNQCLRPGNTIRNENDSSCDASNTAFGRPPICVLRIGDFFNGKIVPNNLDFSFNETTWDLNPEGIGMQPMIVTVNLQFDVIGGHSLTKPVGELQNALSFDFYANTEVYDERSYRNQTPSERKAINQEQGFFNNKLDIEKIVETVEDIDVSERAKAQNFEPFVGELGKTYDPVKASEDKKPLLQEYGDSYLFNVDLDYSETFNKFYNNINNYLNNYVDTQKNLNNNLNPILTNTLIFNKENNYYTAGVSEHPIGNDKKQNIKLNLYPVHGLYKLPSGNELTFPTDPIQSANNFISLKLPSTIDSLSVEEKLTEYKNNLKKRTDYGLLTLIMKEDNVRKAYQQLSNVKRKKIHKFIKNRIENRFQTILQNLESEQSSNVNSFNKAILGIDNVLVPISGVDGEILNSGGGNNYEVIPNGKKVDIDVNSFFGHEPYYKLNIPSSTNLYNTIDATQLDSFLGSEYGGTTYLKNYLDSGGLLDKNNMPYFDFKNKAWNDNGGILTGDTGVSTISSNYKISYNFEKINYEFFDTTQKLNGFYNSDETPLGKEKGLSVTSENVSFNNVTDTSTEKLELFVGNDDATLKNRKLKDNTGNFTDTVNKLNQLFTFTYAVSDITFNKAKREYSLESDNNEDQLEKDISMDSDNLNTNNLRILDEEYKNLTGTYVAFEEMLFHEFYTEDSNFVDDLEQELNSIKTTRNNKDKEEKIQKRFIDGVRKNIQRIKEGFSIPQNPSGIGVKKLSEKIKNQNEEKLNNFKQKIEDANLQSSDGGYTLKMRKTNNPYNYGYQKVKNYRKVEELFNSKK